MNSGLRKKNMVEVNACRADYSITPILFNFCFHSLGAEEDYSSKLKLSKSSRHTLSKSKLPIDRIKKNLLFWYQMRLINVLMNKSIGLFTEINSPRARGFFYGFIARD